MFTGIGRRGQSRRYLQAQGLLLGRAKCQPNPVTRRKKNTAVSQTDRHFDRIFIYQPHKNPYQFYNLVCLLVGRCTIKVEVCEIKSFSAQKDFKSSVSLVALGSVTIQQQNCGTYGDAL